jgi:hypothetical protein
MWKTNILLIILGLIIPIQSFSQSHASDPLSKRYSFGNVTDGSLFKALTLLDQDSINRSLANACILGTSLDELRDNNFTDLEKRIEKLVSSGILKLNEEKYYLNFPVILGKKRELMYDLVWKKAMSLLPTAEPILAKLQKELGNRQDMAFHMFCSRIILDLYIDLWHKEFPEEKIDPAEIWLIYPQHPLMVGTQLIEPDRNAQITVSWNNHCLQDLQSISGLQNILLSGAVSNDFSKENSKVLGNTDSAQNPEIREFSHIKKETGSIDYARIAQKIFFRHSPPCMISRA